MKLQTTIPFDGFYESIHSADIDDSLESYVLGDSNGEPREKLNEYFYSKNCIDWQQVHVDYAKEYAEGFAQKLSLKSLEFASLESPKFYNFETDRIFCSIDLKEVKEIFSKIDKELLIEKIKDKFTSRDGFHSFYSNDLDEWPKDLREWDLNQVGTLLEVYFEQEEGELDIFKERDLFAELDTVSNIGEIIYNHLEPDGTRLVNIADYLRNREER